MAGSVTEHYHKRLVQDKLDINTSELDHRVLTTMLNFSKFILKREFSGKLLDIGCGNGSFVSCCRKNGIDAQGIDINHGVNFEYSKLPYPDDFFDIIFMYSVLEHLHDPANILLEIKRIMNSKGILIIITPNLDQMKFRFYDDPTHVKPYNATNIVRLMQIFDFKKAFVGLWTVKKSPFIWKLPQNIQFMYGRILPFTGLNKFAPSFLKEKSATMLCAFSPIKK